MVETPFIPALNNILKFSMNTEFNSYIIFSATFLLKKMLLLSRFCCIWTKLCLHIQWYLVFSLFSLFGLPLCLLVLLKNCSALLLYTVALPSLLLTPPPLHWTTAQWKMNLTDLDFFNAFVSQNYFWNVINFTLY